MATALLDDELWRLVEPLLPVRRRRFHHPGRKRLDDRRTPLQPAKPSLTAQLHSRGRDGYLLEIVNRGGVPLLNVEWSLAEGAHNWHLLTDVLPEYPVVRLDPRDHVRVPVSISIGGPVVVDLVVQALTEKGELYETTKRLSIYG